MTFNQLDFIIIGGPVPNRESG